MYKLNKTAWYLGYAISVFVVWMIVYRYCPETGLIWTAFKWIILIIGTIIALAFSMIEFDENLSSRENPVVFLGFSRQLTAAFTEHVITGGFLLISVLGTPAGIVMLLMTPVFLLCFVVFDAIYMLVLAIARSKDRRQYDSDTGRFLCPECGRSFYRPSYDVDGTITEGLCPSKIGIKNIETSSGIIPCTGSGRRALDQYCPGCSARVYTKEGKPFVVSMVGAASSGRSSFVLSVAGSAVGASGKGAAATGFYYTRDDVRLSEYRGGRIRPTPVAYQPPCILTVEPGRLSTPRLLYMCDIGGAFFTGSVETDLQPQYAYNDAVVFLFDPSRRDPAETAYKTYLGFINRYRMLNRLDASHRLSVPISVVATHSDRPGPFNGLPNQGVRQRMVDEGYFNLVNAIEKDFQRVSYFACDASREDGSASAVVKHLCHEARSDMEGLL